MIHSLRHIRLVDTVIHSAWGHINLDKLDSSFFCLLVGSLCNCILPEALKATAVRHDPDYQGYDNEKKKLRTAFSCLSSMSMHQREVSMSSLFLHSHYKGCLPPWELKRSRTGSLKEQWEDFIFFVTLCPWKEPNIILHNWAIGEAWGYSCSFLSTRLQRVKSVPVCSCECKDGRLIVLVFCFCCPVRSLLVFVKS